MILSQINFGHSGLLQKGELEDTAENYMGSRFHSGQLCGEYFLEAIARDVYQLSIR